MAIPSLTVVDSHQGSGRFTRYADEMTETLSSVSPLSGEVVGEVPITSPEAVPAAVARGRKAFSDWSRLTHRERRIHLRSFKRTVLQNGERIAEVVQAETGKPLVDCYSYDVLTALTVMDYYVRNAEKLLRSEKGKSWPFASMRGWTEYHPLGVAGVISPWNYPFFLPMIPTVTALAAGCSVVIKPSEITPLSGALISELAESAGLPSDVVQVIQGDGATGAALVAAGVDVVAFTGSTEVGKKVAEAAAQTLTPVVLELGGNDAMVVLEDADLAQTAQAAVWGANLTAGQTCVAVERLYVVDAVFDRFLKQLDHAFDSVSVGTGDGRDLGPIIHPPQLQVIEDHVSDAVAKGARVLRGGNRVERGEAQYYEPTLLVDVDHSMKVMREETFGPVLPVMRVADQAAALELANDSRFGLHGSVWSKNRNRAAHFASQMRSGTVAVNDVGVNFISPTVSFGGIGDSGYGANFGRDGIRSYCYPKSITAARMRWPTSRLLGAWYPRRRGVAYWRALARSLFRW